MVDSPSYAVIGQGYLVDVLGTSDIVGRLGVGAHNINVTGAGTFSMVMCKGATASVASDVATVTGSPVACAEAATTNFTVVGTGNIIITVTYNSAGLTSSTYSWSASSGGAPNASVPISTNSFLADASLTGGTAETLTVDATSSCLNMDWTGANFNPTLAFGSQTIDTYGNVTLVAGMTTTGSGSSHLFWNNNGTLDTKGVILNCTYLGEITNKALTLLSDLTCKYLYQNGSGDTLITNNYNITCLTGFWLRFAYVHNIQAGSSIINCPLFTNDGTNNWNANTATINITGTGTLAAGNVNYNGATFNLNGTSHVITGNPTGLTLGFNPTGAQTITGVDMNALNFGGAGYLTNATADFRSADSQGAIEVWLRTTTATSYYVTSCDTASGVHFIIFGTSVGKPYIYAYEGGGNAVRGTAAINDGKWHHLIYSSNGTTWTIFIDGVQATLTVEVGANTGDWFADVSVRDNITIGAEIKDLTDAYITGEIGYTRIYSRPMLQPEAMTNYLRGRLAPASDTTDLVFNLPMTEGTGNPVDTVGSLTMTLSGTAPAWMNGVTVANMMRTGTGQVKLSGDFTKTGGGTVVMNRMSLSQSCVSPANTFYAGKWSKDLGKNCQWLFTPDDYNIKTKLLAMGAI